MAVNIGPKIGIDGEKEYRKAINEIIQQQKTLKSEMAATASSWDKNTSGMKKAAQQTENLNKQIDTQKKKIEELNKMLEASKKEYGANSTETLKWQEKVNKATAELNNMQAQLKEIPNGLQIIGSAMQDVGGKISTVGDGIKSVGEKFMPLTGAIAGIGTAAVLSATSFEDAMAKVSTIADTTAVPIEDLEAQIVELSNQTGISASEIADNVYNAISAGQETGDAVNFVANATKLARAGFTDSASALDVLTTTLNAYGMEAEEVTHVSDVLINTQNLGKTTVGELASSMGKIIPTAKAAGVSLEQIAAGYSIMTANGIATAESTTYMNSMLNELSKSGTKASTALTESTGKTFQELMADGASLADVLSILQTSAEESGVSMADMFGSAEAGKAALTLLSGGVEEFNSTVDSMYDSTGKTDEAFDKLNTTSFEAQKTINEVKNTVMDLGQTILEMAAPAIKEICDKIKEAMQWFSSLDDSQKQNIVKWGAIVAAIGPVITIIGTVVGAIGSVISVGGTLVSAIGSIVAVLGGPLTAAIAGAIAAGVLIYKNWDTIKTKAVELYNSIKEKFESIKTTITQVFETVKTTVSNTWENIKTTISNAIEKIKGMMTFEFKLPDLKLPHISYDLITVPVLGTIPDPRTLHVEWYAKAMEQGMFLDGATIFGMNNGRLLGGGESGREVIVGASSLYDMIRSAVGSTTNNYGGNNIYVYGAPGQDVKELAREIADIINGDIRAEGAVW